MKLLNVLKITLLNSYLIGGLLHLQAQENALAVGGSNKHSPIGTMYTKTESSFHGLRVNSEDVSNLAKTYQEKMGVKLQLNLDNQKTILDGLMNKNKMLEAAGYFLALYTDTEIDENNPDKALKVFQQLALDRQGLLLMLLPNAYDVIHALINSETNAHLAILSSKDCLEALLYFQYIQDGQRSTGTYTAHCAIPDTSWENYHSKQYSSFKPFTGEWGLTTDIDVCCFKRELSMEHRFKHYLGFLWALFQFNEEAQSAVAFKIKSLLDEYQKNHPEAVLKPILFQDETYTHKTQSLTSLKEIAIFLNDKPWSFDLSKIDILYTCSNDGTPKYKNSEPVENLSLTTPWPYYRNQYYPLADSVYDNQPGVYFRLFTNAGLKAIIEKRYENYDFTQNRSDIYLGILKHYMVLFQDLDSQNELDWFVKESLDLIESFQTQNPSGFEAWLTENRNTIGAVVKAMQNHLSAAVLDKQFEINFSVDDLLADFDEVAIDSYGNTLALTAE